jgi:hypothetical protein
LFCPKYTQIDKEIAFDGGRGGGIRKERREGERGKEERKGSGYQGPFFCMPVAT